MDDLTTDRCEAYVANTVYAFPCGEPSGHEMPHVCREKGQTRSYGHVGPLHDVVYAVTWSDAEALAAGSERAGRSGTATNTR